MKRFLVLLLAVAAILAAALLAKVTVEIYRQATQDEARAADLIVIMGAAEYSGRPSPVFRARLDHGLELWRRQVSPMILTTGGAGGDPIFTEGEVGRNYLMAHKVPPEAIVVEPEAETTAQSIAAIAEIMRRMNMDSCVVVSDGYHIYRTKKMLENRGVKVYGSPRPSDPPAGWRFWWLCMRQAIGYLLWSVGVVI
jgi:uncharacterized SAM-binding protein YcdF (DUF218 family)